MSADFRFPVHLVGDAPALVLTTDSCIQCKMTTRHLTRVGVQFDTINVNDLEDDHREQLLDIFRSKGFQSFPVVLSEQGSWSGFKPDQLDALADLVHGEVV